MKRANKILALVALFLLTISYGCKDLTKLNENPKVPSKVPSETLFANAVRNLSDQLATPNVNSGIFRLLAQQWAQTTYIDESNYDLATRNIPQNFWNAIYLGVIKNLREAKRLYAEEKYAAGTTDAKIRANREAITELVEVYAWHILLFTYGDIPYSQAMDINNPQPAYDDAYEIARNLLTRIDAAYAKLDNGYEAFGAYDLIYGDNINRWKKFAASLKLRIAMLLADVPGFNAKAAVEDAVSKGVFTSQAERAAFRYLSAPPNTNPVWVDLVQSGRKDFVAANTLVDFMNAQSDPRVPFYFTEDASGNYTGGIYGDNNNYATFSKPSNIVTAPDAEHILLDYVEVEFLLAAAVERGYNVGGAASSHFKNAVIASAEYWGVDPATALAFASGLPYTGPIDIGEQMWVAMYNRGWEAWTYWRFFDAPTLLAPPDAQFSVVPVRYPYPVQEQNLNEANWRAAVQKIGGQDIPTVKLFWDRN
jgi:hypothetical protein